MAKTRPKWQGCSRLDRPTWKVSSAPYHTPIHGRAWFRAIFARSRHLSRVPEMTLFMAKTRLKWRGCSRLDRPTWKVSSAPYHTPIHGRAWFRGLGDNCQRLAVSGDNCQRRQLSEGTTVRGPTVSRPWTTFFLFFCSINSCIPDKSF